jgi:peroxidase
LSSITTIWLRDHNGLAAGLKKINPKWSSDTLFYETRRILSAVYQNIVYNEYLPALLGEELYKFYDLVPRESGHFDGYNSNVYPQVINEFSTAAFRYGHTIVAGYQHTANTKYQLSKALPIHHYLFNNDFYAKYMNDSVRGQLMDWSYNTNNQVNSDLNDWLFNGLFYGDSKRSSLAALNIQRGRDHGLQGYNSYRELCGLKRAKEFEK